MANSVLVLKALAMDEPVFLQRTLHMLVMHSLKQTKKFIIKLLIMLIVQGKSKLLWPVWMQGGRTGSGGK